ncbi:unnamed protein product, partial [marine sediment metagenome]
MPVLLPGASLTEVKEVMRKQDIIIGKLPEVELVVGKLGMDGIKKRVPIKATKQTN